MPAMKIHPGSQVVVLNIILDHLNYLFISPGEARAAQADLQISFFVHYINNVVKLQLNLKTADVNLLKIRQKKLLQK